MKILAGLALLVVSACAADPMADQKAAPSPSPERPVPEQSASGRPAPGRPALVGFASLPADTFTDGPRSGQFITNSRPINGRRPPFDRQPVQGISDVVAGPGSGDLLALSDNGFGAKANSADYVLCVYRVTPAFRTPEGGGDATVAVDVAFRLRDPDRHVRWSIVADGTTYPGSDVPVPPEVRDGRLLTGADFDVESMFKLDRTFWIGDEFGPFLLHVDATGKLLGPPVELPGDGMYSPDHPTKDPAGAKIPRGGGFEAMDLLPNWSGRPVALFLEKPIAGEAGVRYFQYDISEEAYGSGAAVRYPLPPGATAVGGGAFVIPGFLLVEGDDGEGAAAAHKQVALARGEGGRLLRVPLVDLLDVEDPHDLNGDGSPKFAFPFRTIGSVRLLGDGRTLLVVNDNDYPFASGRASGEPDPTEFILIRLPRPLEDYAGYQR
ncbi:MAG: Glycerophosphoryl diester phosphodiesterase [uncultured Phycisphaerae bacterium]|uniref:Glycerophosphoryl diester phosphodiesterase n=1 Tax=uncultured Phycisphaerae bacterium TaxID=904963 RepID=A0A6J4NC86_9BACT|nr:MAG: Glycerophosphoryl diester phosphodiesterase [uncultured Phycisphaerae bacterium]